MKISRVKIPKLFLVIFFILFILIIIKLSYVALAKNVEGYNLTEFANNRNTVEKVLYAQRGNIYDVNGETIAQNANSYTLVAILSETREDHVVDKEATAQALAQVLDLEYDYVLERLNKQGYQVEFGTKGRNISENKKQEIEALNLPGIEFVEGVKRYYKKGKMASYVVGYAKENDDGEIVGEMGVEYYYNNILKGKDGLTIYQKDGAGYQMGEAITTDPVSGSDIYLTIDSQIQLIVEDAIKKLENYRMDWVTLNVMDANTGAIVASSASPNFNPNTLEGLESYVNPLVGYAYEPGSTMKIFSWLAAIENDVYNGQEKYKSGTVKVGGVTIKDFNNVGWGEITYDKGFAYSSNVAATNLAFRLGSQKLGDFYRSLGFGEKTNIDLPGEESGVIRINYDTELANASFGQGIMTTPIQNLQALSILTNEGVMLKPYIISKIVDQDGKVTFEAQREELGKKVASDSVDKIRSLMHDVVYAGTSNIWQTNNVSLIGKTGTAQIASPNGGYLTGSNDYIYSFAGIFPEENSRYIFYVSAKKLEGGAVSLSKVITDMVESIANYANITDTKTPVDETKLINLDNYLSGDVLKAQEKLTALGLNVVTIGNKSTIINQYPLKNSTVLKGSKVFLLTDKEEIPMLDIKGWSSNEVISFCNLIGLKYKFNGYGRVDSFNIEVGSIIDLNSTLEVNLST